MQTNVKKILMLLTILTLISNANYLVHLKYSNGTVTQEAIYIVDNDASAGGQGEMELTVNNFQSNFSFPRITMYDPEDIFVFGVNRTTANSEIIGVDDEADAYVVIPEVPIGSMVRVSNGTDVLMDGPLMVPISVEGKSELNMSIITICINDSGCKEGEECRNGSCVAKEPACSSLFIFLAFAASALVLKYKN